MGSDRKQRARLVRLAAVAMVNGLISLAPRPSCAQSATPGDGSEAGIGAPQPGGARHTGAHAGRHGQTGAAVASRLTELKPQIDPWPRLDAGATICRSLPDLQQLARWQRSREEVVGDRPSCRIVTGMVPISILSRVGPGATEVQLAGAPPELAWTNAWLPDRAAVAAQPAGDAPGRR